MRNFLILTKMFGTIDTDQLRSMTEAVSETILKPQESPPPGIEIAAVAEWRRDGRIEALGEVGAVVGCPAPFGLLFDTFDDGRHAKVLGQLHSFAATHDLYDLVNAVDQLHVELDEVGLISVSEFSEL